MRNTDDTELEIGEVARRAGMRPSAVRYYEDLGLVTPERRRGGRRVYGRDAVERLALISFAKNAGFSLEQIRVLLFGFPPDATAGTRWSQLAETKLAELDRMSARIETMRAALRGISRCRCADLDQCAHAIARNRCD
ncbi:MAG TPA: MerR family transcriptional regulator [Thermoanaerobaculia bacterium]|nr:MerR family transcriptional regulator [Thermoanaerobaculia bacterium]